MSHYITIPTNENGIIFDGDMNGVIAEAIAVDPFGFDDVYIYSHGWSTDAYRALDEYNRFSVDLAKQLLLLGDQKPPVFANPPQESLGIGIHWPSEITEDPNSDLNALQVFTFYTMEHRANAVGSNAVYSILRSLLSARAGTSSPLRIFLLGHSFGCKVVCAALQDMQTDIANKTIGVADGTTFRVVLLEPATDNDNLEQGDIYGSVGQIHSLRMLITRSSLDKALNTWFPVASKAANLFKAPKQALGAMGPTQNTVNYFGGADQIPITTGFTPAGTSALKKNLIVADLSPVHQARITSGIAQTDFLSGSHSDINFIEVYNMISGFLFA
jgi:hypothetical protein